MVSHLMIPAWAARRQSHSSLFKSTKAILIGTHYSFQRLLAVGASVSTLLLSCQGKVGKNMYLCITRVWWIHQIWQMNAWVVKNSKNRKNEKLEFLVVGAARTHRMSYYLRQVSPRSFLQNTSWSAAVSRSATHREREAWGGGIITHWNEYRVMKNMI